MIPGLTHRRRFTDLSEQEVLALAISSEEDDARIYETYAERLRADYPQSAKLFDEMPERYRGTQKEHLWRAFRSEAKMPISERRLRTLLSD